MISFIIPAHNEAVLLPAALAALQAAAAHLDQPHEIIVVDDASTDATASIAAQHGTRLVSVSHHHIAATRNSGAAAALGSVLVFVDADTHVDARLLLAAMRAIDGGAIGGGAAVKLMGNTRAHERIFVRMLSWVFRRSGVAPGCFVFCTRPAFAAAGGFDEDLYAAEDVAISRSLAGVGKFVILRHAAHTSDRKLRTHGWRPHLRLFLRFMARGFGVLRDRTDLELWYGPRRDVE